MRSSISLTVVAVLIFAGASDVDAQCTTSPTAGFTLPSFFSGFSPVGSFTLTISKTKCQHGFEQLAKDPGFYEACESWYAQKSLERIGVGVVAGIEEDDGKSALLGSSRFGVSEVLNYRTVNSARTSLQGSTGMDLRLLGKTLKLPRQAFSAVMTPNQHSNWEIQGLNLSVGFKVPTPYGNMEINFNAAQGGTGDVLDRAERYDGFEALSLHDWEWYETPSSYWSEIDLSNHWGIDIASPPLGHTVGGIGAELRLVLGGSIDGHWKHKDPDQLTYVSVPTTPPSPAYDLGQVFTWNRLESSGEANARIKGTIKVGWYEYSKEWTIISVSSQAGNDLDGNPGQLIAQYQIPYKVGPIPCPDNPTAPDQIPWIDAVVSTPPETRPADAPTDLATFANDVTEEVKNTFSLCDATGKPYDPIGDRELQRIASGLGQAKITKDQADADCERLRTFFRDRYFLCEKWPVGVRIYRKPLRITCRRMPRSA